MIPFIVCNVVEMKWHIGIKNISQAIRHALFFQRKIVSTKVNYCLIDAALNVNITQVLCFVAYRTWRHRSSVAVTWPTQNLCGFCHQSVCWTWFSSLPRVGLIITPNFIGCRVNDKTVIIENIGKRRVKHVAISL